MKRKTVRVLRLRGLIQAQLVSKVWFPTQDIVVSGFDANLNLSLGPPPTHTSEEFTRAVYVATGIKLTPHLVNTVFKIFDEDRDNKLSHKEFIGVMKERLHRGDGVSAGPGGGGGASGGVGGC